MTSAVGGFPPWPDLIAAMGLLREDVSEIGGLPATIPHVAAAEEQLAEAERRLGHELDPQHREFLGFGDGWPDFYLGTDLLGTGDLGQGPVWEEINATLDAFYAALPEHSSAPPREEIYPISHHEGSSSVFVIWRGGPESDGGRPVVWLPEGEGSATYENFFQFYRAVYQSYETHLDEDDSPAPQRPGERIPDHFGRFLGSGRLVETLQRGVQLWRYERPEFVSYATCGLSELDVVAPKPQELVCSVRRGQDQAAEHLVRTLFETILETGAGPLPSQVYRSEQPILARTRITGVLATTHPYLDDAFHVLRDAEGGIRVQVVTLLPVTEDEIERGSGAEAETIETVLEKTNPPLLDVTRP